MHKTEIKRSAITLLLSIFSFIIVYYFTVLIHEYSHSTMAWLFGYKENILNIDYGGWLLLHVDEAVSYDSIIAAGHGAQAAMIAISGITSNSIVFLLSIFLYKKPYILKSKILLILFFWSLVVNMVPIVGYIPANTFTTHGDIGRFCVGLNISTWWAFIIGTPLVAMGIIYIFRTAIIKLYAHLPIKTITGQSLYLLSALVVLFLLLFTHGQNPLSDQHATAYSKAIAWVMIFAVPTVFIVCFPNREWVQQKVAAYFHG